MSIVERVARAWCTSQYGPRFFDALIEPGRTDILNAAKAAIEAMREPDGDVLRALTEGRVQGRESMTIWSAAIDAALGKEGS